MIRQRVATGAWIEADNDVFALASSRPSWLRQCWAATLLHPAAALSHRTGAAQLGLDGFRPGHVHVVVPPTATHDSRFATVHRSRHTLFASIDGLRVTRFDQLMIQLAGCVSDKDLRAALHSGVHTDAKRLDLLILRMVELRGRRLPGMSRLVDLVEDLEGEAPTASELERELFELMDLVPDLPPMRRQHPAPWSPRRTTIFDGFIDEWSLIVEADGRDWHTRVADFDMDRERDAEAAIAGLHVMRFTWRRVKNDRAGILDQLRRYGERFPRAA